MNGSGRKRRVAVVMRGRSTREDEIVRGVLDYHYQINHWALVTKHARPLIAFDEVNLERVDGLVGNLCDEHVLAALTRHRIATINTSNRFEQLPLPRVASDERAIGRVGAEHLLELGFPHFGFLTVGRWWFSRQRLKGFEQTVQDIAGRDCHVFQQDPAGHSRQVDRVAAWLGQLPKPVALMAANDILAREAIQAAEQLGLRVPQDVAVLGVDNDEWLTRVTNTPLSSVELGARRIGFLAAQTLDRLMAGEEVPEAQWVAPVGVVTRSSTDIVLNQDPLVATALQFITEHMQRELKVEDLLEQTDVSRKTLENRMKRALGQTPGQAITRIKVEHAMKLLTESQLPVSEIARRCGFPRPNNFSTAFKRVAGCTPGRYRQQGLGQHGTPSSSGPDVA